jgi:hypothetical protein
MLPGILPSTGGMHAERNIRANVARVRVGVDAGASASNQDAEEQRGASRMAAKQSFLFPASCSHLRLACVYALMAWSCLLSRSLPVLSAAAV